MEKENRLLEEVYAELINNKTKEVYCLMKDMEFIGRTYSALVCFKEVEISRKHCTFTKTPDGQCVLTSLGTAGTKVNGNFCPYDEKINLKTGDVIKVLKHEFTFKYKKIPLVILEEEANTSTEDPNKSIEERRNIFYKNQSLKKDQMRESFSELKAEAQEAFDTLQKKKLEAENKLKKEMIVELEKELKNLQDYFKEKENEFLKTQKEMEESLEEEKRKFEERLQKERDLEVSQHDKKLLDLKRTNCELENEYNEVIKKQKKLEEHLDSMKETVGRHLECGVCSEICFEPILLNCGHTFCKFCISTWKKKKKNCPMCRTKIKSEIRNWPADAIIEDYVKSLSKEEQEIRKNLIKERKGESTASTSDSVIIIEDTAEPRRNDINNYTTMDLFYWDEPTPGRRTTRQTRRQTPNNSNNPVEIDLTFFADGIRVANNINPNEVVDLTTSAQANLV